MHILITTDVIHAGGAETFVLRLAQALQKAGHQVIVYPLYKNKVDYKIIHAFAPDVRIVPARIRFLRLLQIIDGGLRRLGINPYCVNFFLAGDLKKIIKKSQTNIVHSHLFTADIVAVEAGSDTGVPVVSTIHGDYKSYSRKLDEGTPVPIRQFYAKASAVLKKLCGIVCISDEQLHFFEQKFGSLALKPHKIYNGYETSSQLRILSKSGVGIDDKAFVFGMVARGIPEKGWEKVIQAFCDLQITDVHLLLVGDSAYVHELKEKYGTVKQITFAGYSSNPIEYIKLFDAGLFASTYMSESLPTVLIEYLSCGVPVVSVAVAECRNMLEANGTMAGILVDLENGHVPVAVFTKVMHRIATDTNLYNQLKQNTAAALQKFNMQTCVKAYENVYENCLQVKVN